MTTPSFRLHCLQAVASRAKDSTTLSIIMKNLSWWNMGTQVMKSIFRIVQKLQREVHSSNHWNPRWLWCKSKGRVKLKKTPMKDRPYKCLRNLYKHIVIWNSKNIGSLCIRWGVCRNNRGIINLLTSLTLN